MRGLACGTRESDILNPTRRISDINAIVLTGGSAFGLSTADGVVKWLAERSMGHLTIKGPIPLVSAAVIFDQTIGDAKSSPDAKMGYDACNSAVEHNCDQGNVGVGMGATVGKWSGLLGCMKGGFGLKSATVKGITVFVAVVVNAVGDVVNEDGSILAGSYSPDGSWRQEKNHYREFDMPEASLTNTTLAVIATDARFSKVECYQLAQRAHDGLVLAIRHVHTSYDGDTVFGVSTGSKEANVDFVANIAVELLAEAIRNAVSHACSVGEVRGLNSDEASPAVQ